MPSVAAIVVTYNPDRSVVDNILNYIDEVDSIIAVDNSEKAHSRFVSFAEQRKWIYVQNGTNLGIAGALNVGMKEAQKRHADYALLMDQDSRFFDAASSVFALVACMEANKSNFMVSSVVNTKGLESGKTVEGCREVEVCITSGTLLNLSLVEEVGWHREKLFIDYVDLEYALRAKKRYLCFGTELLDYAHHRQRQNDIAKAVRAAYEDLTHFQRFSGRFSV
jgi:rhamnosyltransferase